MAPTFCLLKLDIQQLLLHSKTFIHRNRDHQNEGRKTKKNRTSFVLLPGDHHYNYDDHDHPCVVLPYAVVR